jgi:hypothetical protein
LPLVDTTKFNEVWGNVAVDNSQLKMVVTMNLWVSIPSIFINCLAFACSRNSYMARAGFAILYGIIYIILLVLVILWIVIDPANQANASSEFKSACNVAFTIRLVYFITMTLFIVSLSFSHLMVRKSRAKEL